MTVRRRSCGGFVCSLMVGDRFWRAKEDSDMLARRIQLLSLAGMILMHVVSLPVGATNYAWNSPVDGNASNQNNWNPIGVPDSRTRHVV